MLWKNLSLDLVQSNWTCLENLSDRSCPVWTLICSVQLCPRWGICSTYSCKVSNHLCKIFSAKSSTVPRLRANNSAQLLCCVAAPAQQSHFIHSSPSTLTFVHCASIAKPLYFCLNFCFMILIGPEESSRPVCFSLEEASKIWLIILWSPSLSTIQFGELRFILLST